MTSSSSSLFKSDWFLLHIFEPLVSQTMLFHIRTEHVPEMRRGESRACFLGLPMPTDYILVFICILVFLLNHI